MGNAQVNVVNAAGQCTGQCGQCGWSMWGSTWLIECAWAPRHWPVEGWARGIRIRTHSVTYFVGLPLLRSPLVISDPSVATYDLLTLAHILGRWVEMCDSHGKVEMSHNETNSRKSIRITNISVDKRLTNDLYRFLVLGDQWEVWGREVMVVDDGDEQPWWLLIAYLENSHSAGLNINKLCTNSGITSFILNQKLWFYIYSKALTWGYVLVFLGPKRPVWTSLN